MSEASGDQDLATADQAFVDERPRLLGIAYRMLGSATDAQDVVQDAWLRWHRVDKSEVRSPAALLTTIVSRLCIDRLRSLADARITYPGPWLPEPVSERDVIEHQHAQDETLSYAVLLLLERLAPTERAVFVLRTAFNMSFSEIAAVLDARADTCRQWFRRARAHMDGERRFVPDADQHAELLTVFLAAARDGDTDRMQAMLHAEAVLLTDGGGLASAAVRPVTGVDRISTVIAHVFGLVTGNPDIREDIERVSAREALVLREGDAVHSVSMLDIADGSIVAVYVMRNPEKLARLARLAG